MTLPLFEVDSADALPPRRTVSPERRRRERQADALMCGQHPLTVAVGTTIRLHPAAAQTGDRTAAGLRCGGCLHRQPSPVGHARSYPKCDRDNWTYASNGPGTDVRAWWPACTAYVPKDINMTANHTGLTESGHRPPPDGPQPTHPCPCGCGRKVGRNFFACRAGWYRLPFELRQPISANYNRDQAAHAAAMEKARDWYRTHPQADVEPASSTSVVSLRDAREPVTIAQVKPTELDRDKTVTGFNPTRHRTEIWAATSVDGAWHYERIEDERTTWTVLHVPTQTDSTGWPSLLAARRHTARETAAAEPRPS